MFLLPLSRTPTILKFRCTFATKFFLRKGKKKKAFGEVEKGVTLIQAGMFFECVPVFVCVSVTERGERGRVGRTEGVKLDVLKH